MIKLIRHTPLILILALGLLVRTYRLDRPLGDWHSWRQADTASVTRYYAQHGLDLLHPKFDDLSAIPSGFDNPEGYRMVEFPIINALIAGSYRFTPALQSFPIHVASRFFAIAFSLLTSLVLYRLVAKLEGQTAGLIATTIFTFLPFNIFFSTTTLPEVPLVFFTLASIYFWVVYAQKPTLLPLGAFAASAALALLLKPTYLFIAPALVYFYFLHHGFKTFKLPRHYLVAALTLAPFLLWRRWIAAYPEGIPSYAWLLNGSHIRFTGAFFRWLFAERLAKWILGYWGPVLFILGLLTKTSKKTGWFFHVWLLGMLAYLVVFATGNVTHDYYQIFLLPIVAVFAALGTKSLLTLPSTHFNRLVSWALAPVLLAFSFAFSWFHVRDYFNINNPAMVAAGAYVDAHLPQDALVVAPYLGDTAFLYQTNRRGWPVAGDIPKRIDQGADYYITTAMNDETKALVRQCRLIHETDQFALIDLAACDFTISPTTAQ